MPAEPPRPLPKKNLLASLLARENPAARRWLWAGVGVISAAVIFLWGWSLKNQLALLNIGQSPESKIAGKTAASWQALMGKNNAGGVDSGAALKKLRETIQQLAARRAATSSASSTD